MMLLVWANKAAVNIGIRPTIGDDEGMTVEAFLLDFDGDLYGEIVKLEFIARLRAETRFPSLDTLREQLALDVKATREAVA